MIKNTLILPQDSIEIKDNEVTYISSSGEAKEVVFIVIGGFCACFFAVCFCGAFFHRVNELKQNSRLRSEVQKLKGKISSLESKVATNNSLSLPANEIGSLNNSATEN